MNSTFPALQRVLQALSGSEVRERSIICIDGPAGSGKTALANALALEIGDCAIAHMDDFYEGWLNPFSPSLFERVLNNALLPHVEGRALCYPPWDWNAEGWGSEQNFGTQAVLILEGVGACAAPLRRIAQLSVFIADSPEHSLERAISRDGEHLRPQLLQWLDSQTRHFAEDQTAQNCELVIRPSASE